MTWTRLDDRWTDTPELSELSHAVRWHYLAMVQYASRNGILDGVLRVVDARRCSDVDDPDDAISQLQTVSLVAVSPENKVKLLRIADHIPPPSVRAETERARIRKQRERAHKNGDHSLCRPDYCPAALNPVTGNVTRDKAESDHVTRNVTRDTGTGQDGTGQDRALMEKLSQPASEPAPCSVCSTPLDPALARAGETTHPTCSHDEDADDALFLGRSA